MVGTIEPLGVPTLQRGFEERGEKLTVRPSLQADSPDDLGVGCTRLELEKEVVFEEIEVRMDSKKGFTEMDKDGDLKDRVRMKVYRSMW